MPRPAGPAPVRRPRRGWPRPRPRPRRAGAGRRAPRPRRWRARRRGRRRSGCATGRSARPGRRARSGRAAGTHRLSSTRVGRHHDERRVLARPEGERVGEADGVGGRGRPREHRAVGADHVADRVHHRQRADGRVADADRRGAQPARHAVVGPLPLPDRRAPPGTDPPGREGLAVDHGGQRGLALRGAGRSPPDSTRSKIAAVGTIGTGPPADGKPRPLRRERPHDAVGRREAERRPAGEHDRVDVLDELASGRAARARASPARRRAPRPTPRCAAARDDGHARPPARPVPDADAGHVGDQETGSGAATSASGAACARRRRARRRPGRRGQSRRSGDPAPSVFANSMMRPSTSSVRSSISHVARALEHLEAGARDQRREPARLGGRREHVVRAADARASARRSAGARR